jgi:hypothetical protein
MSWRVGMGSKKKNPVTRKKAKKILAHGSVRGKPLTKKQKGMFGVIAGGGKVKAG